MSVLIHQPIRCLFVWTLIIILFLLTQTIAQAAQVTLAGDPNNPISDNYRVFSRLEGQGYGYSTPVWPNSGDDPAQTTCTVNDLANGTSYYFLMQADVGIDESPDSNEINHALDQTNTKVYDITSNVTGNESIEALMTSNQNLVQVVIKMLSDLFERKPGIWPLLLGLFIIFSSKAAHALFIPEAGLIDNFSTYFRQDRRCKNSCHLQPEYDRRVKRDVRFPKYVRPKLYYPLFMIFTLLFLFGHIFVNPNR